MHDSECILETRPVVTWEYPQHQIAHAKRRMFWQTRRSNLTLSTNRRRPPVYQRMESRCLRKSQATVSDALQARASESVRTKFRVPSRWRLAKRREDIFSSATGSSETHRYKRNKSAMKRRTTDIPKKTDETKRRMKTLETFAAT